MKGSLFLKKRDVIKNYFDFCLNSVKPHLPQVFLSLCSAMKTPLPHLGQSLFFRVTFSPEIS